MTLLTTGPLTSVFNKVQYLIAKNSSDPEADAYAKQQAAQAAQDASVKKQKAIAAQADAKTAATKADKDAAAADLVARSKFSSKELITQTSKGILIAVAVLIGLCFVLYGGHIAVNQVIGYGVPFRILTFIYGVICSIWVVPKALYDKYWKGIKLPYYSFLPISTHVPTGDLESIFLSPFCYTEDTSALTARSVVESLYSDAFKNSVATTAVVVAASLAVNNSKRSKTKNASNATPEAPVPSAPAPEAPEAPVPSAPVPSAPEAPAPSAPEAPAPSAPEAPAPSAPAPEAPVPSAPAPEAPEAPVPSAPVTKDLEVTPVPTH